MASDHYERVLSERPLTKTACSPAFDASIHPLQRLQLPTPHSSSLLLLQPPVALRSAPPPARRLPAVHSSSRSVLTLTTGSAHTQVADRHTAFLPGCRLRSISCHESCRLPGPEVVRPPPLLHCHPPLQLFPVLNHPSSGVLALVPYVVLQRYFCSFLHFFFPVLMWLVTDEMCRRRRRPPTVPTVQAFQHGVRLLCPSISTMPSPFSDHRPCQMRI